ncbi:MAG: hypothetical protein RIF32_14080 [Leptospirales bacterium]
MTFRSSESAGAPESTVDLQTQIDALSPRARALFDAHLSFESRSLGLPAVGPESAGAARMLIEDELGRLYDWLADRALEDLLDSTVGFAWVKRRVLRQRPGPVSAATADAVARALRDSLAAREETAGSVLSQEAFELLVDDLSQDAVLRDAVVDGMVHNAVFSLVISEILYHGIADFMSDSKLTNSIPGAQSLFKLGQNFLNQTAPGLRDGFEKSIKEFIKNNAGQIIKNSETSMKKSLSPAVIRQAAKQFWSELSETPIQTITQYVAPEKLPAYREAADLFGDKLRTSPVVEDLLATGLDAFFDSLRDRKVTELLEDIGIDRGAFVSEGADLINDSLSRTKAGAFLENLVTRRLLAFYLSEEASGLID